MITSSEQRSKALKVSGNGLLRSWGVGGAEVSQDASIESVGLGEDAARASEVANLARIDNAKRDGMLVEALDESILITAGGLTNEVRTKLNLERFDSSLELQKTSGRVWKGEGLIPKSEINGGLGDIGSDVDNGNGHGIMECRLFGVVRFGSAS